MFYVFVGKWQLGVVRDGLSDHVCRNVEFRLELLPVIVYCCGIVLVVPVPVAEDPVVVVDIFPCLVEVVCHVGPFDSAVFRALPLCHSSHRGICVAL